MYRLVAVLVLLTACGAPQSAAVRPTDAPAVATAFARLTAIAQPADAKPARRTARVEYRVYGSDTEFASLTYTNGQGGTEQSTSQRITPAWLYRLSVDPGTFVYIAAQNKGESGSVTCEIRVDGAAFKHSVSQGGYAIATCNGAVP
jgi:hypothetical protein